MRKQMFLLAFAAAILIYSCAQPAENTTTAEPEVAATVKATELANRFFTDVINQQKAEVMDEILHASFRSHHYPAPPGTDKAGFIQGVKGLLTAFPDVQLTTNAQFADGDRVFTYFTWTGTHKGTFNGVAATNKQVKVEGMDIWREQDGKLIENWVIMDGLGLMIQLGVVPPPGPPQ